MTLRGGEEEEGAPQCQFCGGSEERNVNDRGAVLWYIGKQATVSCSVGLGTNLRGPNLRLQ